MLENFFLVLFNLFGSLGQEVVDPCLFNPRTHTLHRVRPISGFLGHHLLQQRAEFLGHVLVDRVNDWDPGLEMLLQEFSRGGASKGRLGGQELVERRAQRVDVALLVDPSEVADRLLPQTTPTITPKELEE